MKVLKTLVFLVVVFISGICLNCAKQGHTLWLILCMSLLLGGRHG